MPKSRSTPSACLKETFAKSIGHRVVVALAFGAQNPASAAEPQPPVRQFPAGRR
jgi:hypothetical protein